MSLAVYLMVDDDYVFDRNITHNLNTMAEAAGIYRHLWRPDEIGLTKAQELIEPLSSGLKALIESPSSFDEYRPSNGWGSYAGLVEFVARYIEACRKYPDADIRVSR
ncbi:hypothetical protein IB260_00525 [Pseudomonas sp. PDM23]|uniref:hypothetical protein n=1 Tax=Pseudomonas sp. PDM23 TaxID=2769275 RepID=UPI00177AB6C5|nr:hypothetical protein [Pseudomonas sp. PDM23]MBD9573779.1 hypothetical protein [Pseudomonas sp. PDM23]